MTDLYAAPGNPGIAQLATLHEVTATDPGDVTRLARHLAADLVVIGPEAPLVAGVGDALREYGIAVFGPGAAAARIEDRRHSPRRSWRRRASRRRKRRTVTTEAEADAALAEFGPPYVVKDDALAAGKGVVVTTSLPEAKKHAAGCAKVVIEEYLDGPEVSLFALADGREAVPLLPAQDFKRAREGDEGPNTGGMGAYAPLPWAPEGLSDEVMSTVIMPAIAAMRSRGTPYSGLLYAGLALTSKGVQVVEFNARFGDPETQVVLDRLATPLGGLLHCAAVGDLAAAPALEWLPGTAVTVVIAAEGYPGNPALDDEITIEGSDRPGAYLLHAGTRQASDRTLLSAGGRVLNAVGSGPDLAAARAAAYEVARKVTLRGSWYRRDIAQLAAQLPLVQRTICARSSRGRR